MQGIQFLFRCRLFPILDIQLLRFLQSGVFRRIGSNQNQESDVRVISATNKNLLTEVNEGKFREDLFYRLNVITLRLPSLHERKDDIPLLIDYFLKRKPKKEPPAIDPSALEVLKNYGWPGNVRELENVIERATILCSNNTIRVNDLALPIGKERLVKKNVNLPNQEIQIGSALSLEDIEKAHIRGVLQSVGSNKTLAAKILNISLKTLYTKIGKYQIANLKS